MPAIVEAGLRVNLTASEPLNPKNSICSFKSGKFPIKKPQATNNKMQRSISNREQAQGRV